MSKTVDERVVSMQFDNAKFEKNVQTSMRTLEKLKQSLNLKGAAKGLEGIDSASKKIDFSPLSKGVETIGLKFNAMYSVADQALRNITNSVMATAKNISSAFTIDPIKTGFQEYETQINAIQTILANTQSKGGTLENVNSALDELNTYADKTIYNFTEMTRNIGTFTAAGVDLDKSVTSIKGIANLAAVSGSNAQQASTAMYQLSQALAAGKVSLMDWNSVVNAGMGGELFQNALKRTAKQMGHDVDGMIQKYGSFRESLTQGGWLTAEVLTETLTQISGAYSEADLIAKGYSESQAKEIVELANTAVDAATKVKTFTQLWDTLKEAAQSGWTQSWEIIVGDFEEARSLLTEVSDTFGAIINKSAETRNAVLQGWKDLGGRTALIDAFRNAFEGIGSIIKPISEAFHEIFPPVTAEQLYNFTVGIKNLTEHMKISDEAAGKLKSTFKGIFSVVDIFIDGLTAIGKGSFELIGNLVGVSGGILDVSASLGDGISGFRDYIKETDLFGEAVEKATGFVEKIIDKLKEFGTSIKDAFTSSDYEGFFGFFNGLWNVVKRIGSGIINVISSVGSGIAQAFGENSFFEVLNSGLFADIMAYVIKFIRGLSDTFDGVGGVLENVTGILDEVRGCFEAYQNQLKAGTLIKIATAIGVLAASIFLISTIDADSLTKSLGAMTVLFAELIGSLALLGKIKVSGTLGFAKVSTEMIAISTAIVILSAALKNLSSLDWEEMAKGLVGVGALMAELSIFLNTAKFGGKTVSTAVGIVILSSAMLILGEAVKNFGGMNWTEIGKGLASIGALLAELAIFSNLTGNAKHVVSTGTSLVLIAASMKIFASSISDFGGMNWGEIGKGLTAMGGALAEVAIATNLMPKNMISIGTGLAIVGASMMILANAMSSFGTMSWTEIGKGLVVMGGALVELAIGLNLMNGTLAGSAALVVAAGAMAVMAPVMKSLGELSWTEIAKGLISLAGAFAVVGIAGLLLTPLVPTILGLAGAFALFGVAALGIGGGLALIGAGLATIAYGITTLGAAIAAGATALVAGLSVIILGIADLIPSVAEKLGEGIVEFVKVIGDFTSQITDSLLKLLCESVNSLAVYAPQIVDSLVVLLIGIMNGLSEHMPEFIVAAVNLIGSLFQGIVDALNGIDTENLLNGIVATGLVTALMYALSGVTALIPGAMLGVLGVGAVIAELAIVLAAIGGLAQISGLQWLVEEGGKLLQSIGTAIGQFIGGIVGGFAEGVSSSFPKIGSDLSDFMVNIQPFVDGAKKIDREMLNGIKTLSEAILLITAVDFMNGIASWITGGSSIVEFSKQLGPFGEAMQQYSANISGINPEAVTASATAAQSLAELAANLPNSGGLVSWFTGDNDVSEFADQLILFGEAMRQYSDSINGINPEAITASATAAKSLSELASNLPNSGGVVSWFTGDNDISEFADQLLPFGQGMKAYSDAVSGLDANVVQSSVKAANALSELATNLPNSGGLVSWFTGENDINTFGQQLILFGIGMKAYANTVSGMDTSAVESSAVAAKALSELATNLPNSGGMVSWFTGDNDLSSFAEQLIPFGRSMRLYSLNISGINSDAIINSANAAKALSELAANLPNTGGLVGWFTGENDLSDFGNKLIPFGIGMKAYATAVDGIDTSAIEASANAAKVLSDLATNLPNNGGFTSWFTGDNDLAEFGSKLIPFGIGMKAYSTAVDGIDSSAVESSANAAMALSELASNLPNNGGLVSWFTGDNDLGVFGEQLIIFGRSMKSYAMNVANMDTSAVESSATAAKSLSELAANLPHNGGFVSWFTGDNKLGDFAQQLIPFGIGMKAYATAVDGIDSSAVESSANAAMALSELAAYLPNTGGVVGWFMGETDISNFGSQLVPFGQGMKAYSDAVKDISSEDVEASVNAARALSELSNGLAESGGLFNMFTGEVDLGTFGDKLVPLGQGLKLYSDSVINVNSEAIATSVDSAKKIVELLNNMSGLNTSGVGSFANALDTLGKVSVDNFINAFRDSESKLNAVGTDLVEYISNGIQSKHDSLLANVSEMIEQLVERVESRKNELKSAGTLLMNVLMDSIRDEESRFKRTSESLMDTFASGISGKQTKISSTLLSVLQEAIRLARGYYNQFYNAATYVVEGFANGISDNTYKAEARASAMAAAAANAARRELNEHSPSKVFYKIGDFAGIAFVNALADYGQKAYKSGAEIASNARSGLSDAIRRIGSMIDSGMDANPTIRPVLDLTDIQSKTRMIGRMLNNTATLESSVNLGSISSMMSLHNQNKVNDDIVMAINKLRKDLGNVGSTSYYVNGITYDDGSVVSEAVKDLIRAAKVERRI